MPWRRDLRRDPLPWLLEPENPSARYLTLRHLLDGPDEDTQVSEARAAIPHWPPVREILAAMHPVEFWGRADRPFYGGAVGTHATLNLLADLGMPSTPQIEAACENLLERGQHAHGGFSYDGTPGRVLLCYSGNAPRTLIRFGYLDDPRVQRALEYLAERVRITEGRTCPYADRQECQWGMTKALAAFAEVPAGERTPAMQHAIRTLADALLDHDFDFQRDDARWLDFGFPLDYQSDLVELCDVLARLEYTADTRFRRLFALVLEAQTQDGRWVKRYGTRALQVERKGEPSKWITIWVLRAVKRAWETEHGVGRR